MKKILVVLMIVLFAVIGCVKKEVSIEKDNLSMVKINGTEFEINKETEFKDLEYTIVEDFRELIFDKYVQYEYRQEDNKNLLFFRVFYYKNKDNEAARKDLGIEDNLKYEDGKTDNIEYKMIDTHRTDGTIHFYFINKDEDTYVINFVSQYDIQDFENKVMKTIKLK